MSDGTSVFSPSPRHTPRQFPQWGEMDSPEWVMGWFASAGLRGLAVQGLEIGPAQ